VKEKDIWGGSGAKLSWEDFQGGGNVTEKRGRLGRGRRRARMEGGEGFKTSQALSGETVEGGENGPLEVRTHAVTKQKSSPEEEEIRVKPSKRGTGMAAKEGR